MENALAHYGMPRRSGRYPWGSGENPYQHSATFLSRVNELSKSGLSQKEIAESMGMSTGELRAAKAIARNQRYKEELATAKSMKQDGATNVEIAKRIGKSEAHVRDMLANDRSENTEKSVRVADYLKKRLDQTDGLIDVGADTELYLSEQLGTKISKEKVREALMIMEKDGYKVVGGRIDQVTNPGKKTTIKAIGKPGTKTSDIWKYDIHPVQDFAPMADVEDGKRPATFKYPSSIDSKRVKIRYAEDGGVEAGDGTMLIRRGVPDLSLGPNHYAQVRILVDGTHYLKGMARYANDDDNMPDGCDIWFNTNKHKGTPKKEVLKPIKDDPNNPFGALIKAGGQSYYTDPKTGKKKLSAINMKASEGDWGAWKDAVSSQMLSKQPDRVIRPRLELTIANKRDEFDEISRMTNPAVKKKLLYSFADDCDAASVHLKAAAFPRQKYQVILPVAQLKDTEVYAPNFRNGEKVALIRHPHGGIFEIPILTVNNKNKAAQKAIPKDSLDAIGINSNVASRLSGADFDGDTVLVIPTSGKIKIKNSPPLRGLIGFEPKEVYSRKPGDTFKRMNNTQTEMGKISNLITDMTMQGATEGELARAVRHSMVVIDAEKHDLNYKQSEIDNGIAALKKRYQGHINANGNYSTGAATIISRAKSEVSVPKRQGSAKIADDGSLYYKTADKLYYQTGRKKPTQEQLYSAKKSGLTDNFWIVTDKGVRQATRAEINKASTGANVTGLYFAKKKPDRFMTQEEMAKSYSAGNKKIKMHTQPSTQMAETKDAYSLVSPTRAPAELAYAEYANNMKALANQARKEAMATGNITYSRKAAEHYKNEVASISSKLNTAKKNSPRERTAQAMANAAIKAKQDAYPELKTDASAMKKLKQQEIESARIKVGARRTPIKITDSEWEAIQAGAISESRMNQILQYVDMDSLKEKAMPRDTKTLSTARINRIKAMYRAGESMAEIADALGISRSTVSEYVKAEKGLQ